MSKCFERGKKFERLGGDILLPKCDDCKEWSRANPMPEAYVSRAGILAPNPEWPAWDEKRKARCAALT